MLTQASNLWNRPPSEGEPGPADIQRCLGFMLQPKHLLLASTKSRCNVHNQTNMSCKYVHMSGCILYGCICIYNCTLYAYMYVLEQLLHFTDKTSLLKYYKLQWYKNSKFLYRQKHRVTLVYIGCIHTWVSSQNAYNTFANNSCKYIVIITNTCLKINYSHEMLTIKYICQ